MTKYSDTDGYEMWLVEVSKLIVEIDCRRRKNFYLHEKNRWENKAFLQQMSKRLDSMLEGKSLVASNEK